MQSIRANIWPLPFLLRMAWNTKMHPINLQLRFIDRCRQGQTIRGWEVSGTKWFVSEALNRTNRKEISHCHKYMQGNNCRDYNRAWNLLQCYTSIVEIFSSQNEQIYVCYLVRCIIKIVKATISFAMAICPSLCPHGTTWFPMNGFSWNLMFEYF